MELLYQISGHILGMPWASLNHSPEKRGSQKYEVDTSNKSLPWLVGQGHPSEK